MPDLRSLTEDAMKIITISRFGVHFTLDGDEVIWMWQRLHGCRWFSTSLMGPYPSRQAIRDEWKGYENSLASGT